MPVLDHNPRRHWLPARYPVVPAVPTEFDPMADTGALLRYLRQRHDLSFHRMAYLVGTDTSTIVRIASGERRATYPMLLAICQALPLSRWEQDALMASAGFLPPGVRLGWRPVLGEVASAISLLAAHPARLARYEQQLLRLAQQLLVMEGP